jgi:hypothetical protein
MPHGLEFDGDAWRARCERRLARLPADSVPVMSQERLAGNPVSGGYDSAELAMRIRSTMPGARVLIIVREQCAMLKSVYRHYVREGGPLSFAEFVAAPETAKLPKFTAGFLEYDRLAAWYVDLFGSERVLVLPVEMLIADASTFVGTIAAFAGQPRAAEADLEDSRANPGPAVASLPIRRAANRLVHRSEISPGALLRVATSDRVYTRVASLIPRSVERRVSNALDERASRFCVDRYRASNTRLSDLMSLDFASFGYDAEPLKHRQDAH